MKQHRRRPSLAPKSPSKAASQGAGQRGNGFLLDQLGDSLHGAFHGLFGEGLDSIHDWVFGDHDASDHADPTSEPAPAPSTATGPAPTAATSEPEKRSAVSSAEEGNEHFLTQFQTQWNPTGPLGSTNCGPASLAMMMSAKGAMPEGLTAEQRIDHARALMNPGHAGIQVIDGVPFLDRDKSLSTIEQAISGVDASGGEGSRQSGWAKLDELLESEGVAMGYGTLDDAWREKFPERVGSGDIAHFNAILGKTDSGEYIVNDPMHTGGSVEMSRGDLEEFFGGAPGFVAWQ